MFCTDRLALPLGSEGGELETLAFKVGAVKPGLGGTKGDDKMLSLTAPFVWLLV
ncbi:MAG: hypothetical protein VKN60_02460 [Cyanobacteriota bacterium]|nr:hypothetical protein [Cyanobacteriota bacterium]